MLKNQEIDEQCLLLGCTTCKIRIFSRISRDRLNFSRLELISDDGRNQNRYLLYERRRVSTALFGFMKKEIHELEVKTKMSR